MLLLPLSFWRVHVDYDENDATDSRAMVHDFRSGLGPLMVLSELDSNVGRYEQGKNECQKLEEAVSWQENAKN